ncbi:hypothetical protein BVX94_01090 [bacterium B17]|nr:hypothetical protein BVX94_01090 [bacterium B17]
MIKALCLKRVYILIVLVVAFLMPVMTSAGPAKLPKLQETYSTSLEKINKTYNKTMSGYQTTYIKTLEALKTNMQKKAKLEGVLAIDEEIKRFEASPVIDSTLISSIPEVKAIQLDYMKKTDNLPLLKARQIVSLAAKYDKALESYQNSLTQNGSFQNAVAVKAERDALQEKQEVSSATFIVAEAESAAKTAKAESRSRSTTSKKPLQSEAAAKMLAKNKWSGSAESRIKKRFDDLGDIVAESNWQESKDYVDPEAADTQSAEQIQGKLKTLFKDFTKKYGRHYRVSVEKVTMNDDEDAATLVPKVRIGMRWQTRSSQEWKLVDGDWYVSIDGVSESSGDDDDDDLRDDRDFRGGRRRTIHRR